MNVVRYDSATGARRDVLITAAQLTPPGSATPLEIEDLSWSRDAQRVLVFTNTRRVWRTNSRGDYWLLDRRSRAAEEDRRQRAGSQPDVCEVQSRRDEGRLRARRTTSTSRTSPPAAIDAADAGRHRPGHQRRLRLGERGRARSPRLLPLESGRLAHRLLAVRHARRRQLPAHVLPGQGARDRHAAPVSADRPVPVDDERPLSARRNDEFGGAGRRRAVDGRRRHVDAAARRPARALRRADAMGRRAHAARPAVEPAAEHRPLPAGGRRHRIGARDVDGS